MRLVVGVTGATGAPIAVRVLELLHAMPEVEVHLVMSRWAVSTLELETGLAAADLNALADVHYRTGDQAAAISSGSFHTDGMVIVPCSMKTLAGIRTGYADTLIARAADVTLKERRPLVLVPREMPLSEIHLDNMLALSRMGARIRIPDDVDPFVFLFSESAARAVVAVSNEQAVAFIDYCTHLGLPATEIGLVTAGDALEFTGQFAISLDDLHEAHTRTIPALFA